MINQGQVLDRDNLNKAFVSKLSTGTQIMSGSLNIQGTLTANGSGLTGLNATNITTGILADARLSANVFLLNTAQTIPSINTFTVEQRFSRTTYTDPKSGYAAAIKYSGSMAGDTALFVGDVTLGNGTTPNRLAFTTLGTNYAPPTGSTTSAGTKIMLWDAAYSFGIEGGAVWYNTQDFHKFYTSAASVSTLRMSIGNAGVTIANALTVSGTTTLTGSAAFNGGITVNGPTYLNGNVNLGNASGNVISIVGTSTFAENVTMKKNLSVEGEIQHSSFNEFPDPLLASGGVAEWVSTNGTATFDPAQSPTGTGAYGSLKIVPTTSDHYAIYDTYFDVTPGEWITFSTYLFSTVASRQSQIMLYWYKADYNFSSVKSTDLLTNTATATIWTRYNVSGQAPSDARYVRVRVDNDGFNASTNATMFFSGFQLERGHAMTGFSTYVGGNASPTLNRGGINIVGVNAVNNQGIMTLYNDSGNAGVISSKNNYGIRLEYNTGNIVIGGANSGTYASKVAIGKATTPTATLDVYGNIGSFGTNFRVSFGPNTGSLANTEFRALTDTNGAGAWAAMYAIKGAATYAGLFWGAVQVDGGSLSVNGGQLQLSDEIGAAKLTLRSPNSSSLYIVGTGSTTASIYLGTTYDNDRTINLFYTPGTTGASAGNLQIGQLYKNSTNFTHGITTFYTAGTESMRISANGSVSINSLGNNARNTLDVRGGVVIGSNNTYFNLVDGGLSIGNLSTDYAPLSTNWTTTGSTMILNGLTNTTIAFHDAGDRVDFIRVGAGTMTLGYDGGWGSAAIRIPGNTSMTGTLSVTGVTTVAVLQATSTTTLGGTLRVAGLVTLDSGISVTGATTLAALTVNGVAQLNNTLGVTGAVTLSSTLAVGGGTTVTGVTTLNGLTYINNTLSVTAAATFGTTLTVTGKTTLNNTLIVAEAGTFSKTLGVTGATTLSSTLNVTSTTTLTGAAVLQNTLGLSGAATFNSTLTVAGAVSFTTTLGVTGRSSLGAVDVGGTLGVTGATTLTTLIASGIANLNSGLNVTGLTTLNGELTVASGIIKQGTAAGKLALYGYTSSTNSLSWIEMWGADGTGRAGELTLAGSYISLRTGSTSTTSGTEVVTVTAAGSTGLGTTTPAEKLHVVGNIRGRNSLIDAVNGYGVAFWASDNFKIYMSSTADATWGGQVTGAGTSDYNMYLRMTGGGTNRGFVFQTNAGKVAQIEGTGKINTAVGVRVANKFEMVYNSTEDSLDFVYG